MTFRSIPARPLRAASSVPATRGHLDGNIAAHRPAAYTMAILIIALTACGRPPAPSDPTTRALYRDLERQVTVAATTGWISDRLEIEHMLESALDSSCRVEPAARRTLQAWLEQEIARRGGPVERAWRERDKDLSQVGDLLVLTRVQRLLARTEELASDCPFWLEPELPFHGRQISEQRFVFAFGGGGKLITVRKGNRSDLNAGGAGRLLLGRALTDGHTLFFGIEMGGSAAFPRDEMGERTSLVIGVDLVAPVVYRRMFTNSYAEVEAGWLGHTSERDWGTIDHGIHLGVAFGVRGLRTRFLFPGLSFGASWERTFQDGSDVTMVKLGARVAFDLHL